MVAPRRSWLTIKPGSPRFAQSRCRRGSVTGVAGPRLRERCSRRLSLDPLSGAGIASVGSRPVVDIAAAEGAAAWNHEWYSSRNGHGRSASNPGCTDRAISLNDAVWRIAENMAVRTAATASFSELLSGIAVAT